MDWFFLTLRYVFTAIPFVFAVLSALIGFWMVIAAASKATTGAWVVGFAFLIETAFVTAPYVPMGLMVSTDDLAFALLAAALIMRALFFKPPRFQTMYAVWLGIGAMFFISLGLGLNAFGTSAGVEARANFYFWMAGLYFASFSYPPEVLKKLWRLTQWFAWLVAAIVIYRWVGLKFGFVSAQLVEFAGASSEFRVVGSSPTFFLAAVGTGYFAAWLRYTKRLALVGTMFMLGLVLVLQHRSVWVATLGALVVVAWHEREYVSEKIAPIFGMAALMVGLLAAFVVLDPSSRLTESISKSAISATASEGTHMDRLLGWQVLLRDFAGEGPQQWTLGKPYGSGYERWVEGHFKDYSPHNFYIQLLLRMGAVGLILFLSVHVWVRRKLLLHAAGGPAHRSMHAVMLAVLAANLLFFVPYQGFYLQGVFYGVLIAYLAAQKRPLGIRSSAPPYTLAAEQR